MFSRSGSMNSNFPYPPLITCRAQPIACHQSSPTSLSLIRSVAAQEAAPAQSLASWASIKPQTLARRRVPSRTRTWPPWSRAVRKSARTRADKTRSLGRFAPRRDQG